MHGGDASMQLLGIRMNHNPRHCLWGIPLFCASTQPFHLGPRLQHPPVLSADTWAGLATVLPHFSEMASRPSLASRLSTALPQLVFATCFAHSHRTTARALVRVTLGATIGEAARAALLAPNSPGQPGHDNVATSVPKRHCSSVGALCPPLTQAAANRAFAS